MIGSKMEEALNRHYQAEAYSAYLYLAMSAWCESKAFKGFARWLRIQSDEEAAHGKKSLEYLLARGGTVKLGAIPAPPSSFGSVLDVFEKVLEHERQITATIHELYRTATSEKDLASEVFLQWFVSEQVEEEARVQEIVDRVKLVSDRPSAVLYLDKEYGKRAPGA